jgi:hypothetical protein
VRLSLTKGMITVDFLADPPGTGLHVPSQTTVSWSKAFRKTPHRCCHGGVYGEGPFPTSPAARQTSISRRRPARANCVAVAASSVTNVAPARSPMARTTASSSVTPPSRPTGPPPRRVVYGEGHSRPAQPHGKLRSPVGDPHANCVAVAASSVTNVAPARSPMGEDHRQQQRHASVTTYRTAATEGRLWRGPFPTSPAARGP